MTLTSGRGLAVKGISMITDVFVFIVMTSLNDLSKCSFGGAKAKRKLASESCSRDTEYSVIIQIIIIQIWLRTIGIHYKSNVYRVKSFRYCQ